MRELLAALRREPRAHLRVANADRIACDSARALDLPLLPELREIFLEADGNAGRLDDDDDVLLARPRIVRPVRRAAPDRVAVAHDVLVVHQIRPAGNGRGLERQRLDQIGLGLRRRRDGRTVVDLVHVVDEPDVDAALVRTDECAADDVARLVVQPDVVERELERLARAVDERRDLARDVQRRLAAVGERVNLDQDCCSPRINAYDTSG